MKNFVRKKLSLKIDLLYIKFYAESKGKKLDSYVSLSFLNAKVQVLVYSLNTLLMKTLYFRLHTTNFLPIEIIQKQQTQMENRCIQ